MGINREYTTREQKALALGVHIAHNNSTIRETSMAFNISKSYVHALIHEVLDTVDYDLYLIVKEILERNKKRTSKIKKYKKYLTMKERGYEYKSQINQETFNTYRR